MLSVIINEEDTYYASKNMGHKMSSLDELTSSLKKLGQKLSFEGRRTAIIARLKIDLKSYDTQRRDVLTRLGEKVFDLKKRHSIKDERLIEALAEQFDELHDIEKRIEKTLDEIHDSSLIHEERSESADVDNDTQDDPMITLTPDRIDQDAEMPE